jgi:mRNA-degrading endonuclease toxin of MazEF toxin-antitoxin module
MKDFDSWNIVKKTLVSSGRKNLVFHEREIWWCSFGVNVGNEQDGTGNRFERPCIIVRTLSPTTCLAIPLSTKKKLPIFQVTVTFKDKVNFALLDQVRVIDSGRLRRKIGYVPVETFKVIGQRIREMLG